MVKDGTPIILILLVSVKNRHGRFIKKYLKCNITSHSKRKSVIFFCGSFNLFPSWQKEGNSIYEVL